MISGIVSPYQGRRKVDVESELTTIMPTLAVMSRVRLSFGRGLLHPGVLELKSSAITSASFWSSVLWLFYFFLRRQRLFVLGEVADHVRNVVTLHPDSAVHFLWSPGYGQTTRPCLSAAIVHL